MFDRNEILRLKTILNRLRGKFPTSITNKSYFGGWFEDDEGEKNA
jgi:hypothetical protein